MSLFNISFVNSLEDEQFRAIFGNVVELSNDAAVQVMKKRPYANVAQLIDAFHTYLDGLSLEGKLMVLKLHPDLAGRVMSELTRESADEQRSAGLDEITVDQKRIINNSNERYKAKFGFPFIICAKENKVQSIIEGLQSRYNNSREQEIITGINEVKKICKFRVLDIVKDDD